MGTLATMISAKSVGVERLPREVAPLPGSKLII